MGCTAKAVANFFLGVGRTRKAEISPLKIQKLVYVSHGWHLALGDEPLVSDEYVEAWQYGPVFPSVYHEFKHYGRSAILRDGTEFEFDATTNEFHVVTPHVDAGDANAHALLDRIWEVYGGFSGLQLSAMTHAPGTPWAITRKKHQGMRNIHIQNDLIRQHYREMMEA